MSFATGLPPPDYVHIRWFVHSFHNRRPPALRGSGAQLPLLQADVAVGTDLRYHAAVQLRLPWSQSDAAGRRRAGQPPAESPVRHLELSGTRWRVVIARHPKARRYVLRLTPDGRLRLTVPRGSSIEGGLRFVTRQAEWISREEGRRQEGRAPWRDGQVLWWRGERVALRIEAGSVVIGEDRFSAPAEGQPLRAAFEIWARGVATRELPPRLAALATVFGERVARVRIGNQRSRWGSCAPSGTIALNWRLLQTPPFVSDYVIVHELMHLRQPNHSRRFWREVEKEYPRWREAERWLRTYGRVVRI